MMDSVRDGDRTPSPVREPRTSFCREHSPWTAQRVRKKGRRGPNLSTTLPQLAERASDLEPRASDQLEQPAFQNSLLRQLSLPASAHQDSVSHNECNTLGMSSLMSMQIEQQSWQIRDREGDRYTQVWMSSSDSSSDERESASSDDENACARKFKADKEHGLLLLQRTPLREFNQREESVAGTPSPDMPAPGIQQNVYSKAPPRVPSSCRTIRRVLVESPVSSRRSSWRGDESKDCTRESSPCRTHVAEGTVSKRPQTAACLESFRPSPLQFQSFANKQQQDGPFKFGSPEFSISRGRVTPNNLIPSWDEENQMTDRSEPRGCSPYKGRMRSLDLQGGDNGNEMNGEQAWHGVKRGAVKPDDIDTLNALLKAYCKVKGDPEEAEQVVKDALQDGRIKANASTYHHMTTLWTQHDQLNNRH